MSRDNPSCRLEPSERLGGPAQRKRRPKKVPPRGGGGQEEEQQEAPHAGRVGLLFV